MLLLNEIYRKKEEVA